MKAATRACGYSAQRRSFQSTPPVKAATIQRVNLGGLTGKFQSTPPVKAATLSSFKRTSFAIISIHAAREGGDACTSQPVAIVDISIHAAREGGDPLQCLLALKHVYFNPRRP